MKKFGTYCQEQGIHKFKTQSCSNGKNYLRFSVLHKHSKFCSVSLDQKVELKPLFSEECQNKPDKMQF